MLIWLISTSELDGRTDRLSTDRVSYRVECTRLKTSNFTFRCKQSLQVSKGLCSPMTCIASSSGKTMPEISINCDTRRVLTVLGKEGMGKGCILKK